jgi:hypothetical protein
MRLTTIVLAAAFAVAAPSTSSAQAPGTDTGLGAARTLLKASGAVDAMLATMRANIPAQRQALPQVPAEFWTAFEGRLAKEAPLLVDSIAAVYAHKFSVRELQEITAFYNSPIGRKLVQSQPAIIAESSAIGQRWGARIGEEVAKSLMN